MTINRPYSLLLDLKLCNDMEKNMIICLVSFYIIKNNFRIFLLYIYINL